MCELHKSCSIGSATLQEMDYYILYGVTYGSKSSGWGRNWWMAPLFNIAYYTGSTAQYLQQIPAFTHFGTLYNMLKILQHIYNYIYVKEKFIWNYFSLTFFPEGAIKLPLVMF